MRRTSRSRSWCLTCQSRPRYSRQHVDEQRGPTSTRRPRAARRQQAVPLLAARKDVSAQVVGASIAAVLLVAVTGVASVLPRLAVGPSTTSAVDRAFANLPAPWATEATDIPALVATAGP